MVAPGTRNPPDVVTTEIAPRAGPVPHYFPLFYRESTNIQVFSITVLTRFCRGDRNGWLRKKLDLLRSSFAIFRFFRPIFFSTDQKNIGPKFFRTRKNFSTKNFSSTFFFRPKMFFESIFFSSPELFFSGRFFFESEKKLRSIFCFRTRPKKFDHFFFSVNFFFRPNFFFRVRIFFRPNFVFGLDLKNSIIFFFSTLFSTIFFESEKHFDHFFFTDPKK